MGGRSLLLFTSHAALQHCHHYLQNNLDAQEASRYLRQGEDDSARLLQRFKADESLSLLATDSFKDRCLSICHVWHH